MIRTQSADQTGAKDYAFDALNLPGDGYTATPTLSLLGYYDDPHHLPHFHPYRRSTPHCV